MYSYVHLKHLMCSRRNGTYLCLSTYVNTVRHQVLLLSSSSMILLTITYVYRSLIIIFTFTVLWCISS